MCANPTLVFNLHFSNQFSLSTIAALLYALFGIPIILLYLSTMGEGLSSAMRCIFKRLRASSSKGNSSSSSNSNSTSSSTTTPSSSTSNNILGGSVVDPAQATAAVNNNNKNKIMEIEKRQYASWNHSGVGGGGGYNNNYLSTSITVGSGYHKKQKQSAVPISICIMILICYITCGAAVFHELQTWSVLESIYFCFTALSTIGFGDLQPRNDIGMYVASAYIILGMAIVAMCFSLIQTELVIWMRKFHNANEQSSHHEDEITLANVTITPIKS
jgi:potassium channel subfamily K member 18